MGEHTTWIHLIPAYWNLQEWAGKYLERHWKLEVVGLGRTHFTMIHVVIGVVVVLLLTLLGLSYRRRVAASRDDRLVPESRFGVRNLFELIIDATLSIGEGVMGREKAEKFLPLLGTLVFFILFNNIIGLVPGMVPATDTLKTNFGIALLVFFMTHIVGVKESGMSYFKHFLGPIWWLTPLILPIEIISHLIRPISLSLRLLGNMFADHKVLGTFFLLVPILVPLPFYVLGILVCVVQTLVFTLLSMIYIDQAMAHEEH
ncbi:MAG: F0F1 ATP synthase subunit A [Myxococcales bacterium]|nr:F0F1 ATP synthase subunit A [Myxococcales bacterium]